MSFVPEVEYAVKQYGRYGATGQTMYEVTHTMKSHSTWKMKKGPIRDMMTNTEIGEDTLYGLVPLASFGDALNVPTPTADSLIQLVNVMWNCDAFRDGLTLEKLDMSGLTAEQMMDYVRTGNRQRS